MSKNRKGTITKHGNYYEVSRNLYNDHYEAWMEQPKLNFPTRQVAQDALREWKAETK